MPIDSTAVILRKKNQIYWLQRHPSMKFMGRFYGFVGGKVDQEDFEIEIINPHNNIHDHHIVCAVRETFEETGFLPINNAPHPHELTEERQLILSSQITFKDILSKHQLTIDGSSFQAAGQWITPSFQNIRFSSNYLLLNIDDDVTLTINDREHLDGQWIDPEQALLLWENGKVYLPPPVVYCLKMMCQKNNDEELLKSLNRPPQIYGQPGKRIEFKKGIQLVPLKSDTLPPATHTNLYIVGDQNLFFIDPATTYIEDRQLLSDYLDHLKTDGMIPHKILLTHQHQDHVSAAKWMHETYQIPIAASQITKDLLTPVCPVHEIINDGDEINIDDRLSLRAIATPGHAPGHLCFLEQTTKTLFCGDMISGFGTVLVSPTDGGDMIDYINSLKNLISNYDFDLLLPAHGGSIGAAKEALQDVIDHRQWRENKLLELTDGKITDLDSLVKKLYSDVEEKYLPYAHLSTLAIIKKLQKENKLPYNIYSTNS